MVNIQWWGIRVVLAVVVVVMALTLAVPPPTRIKVVLAEQAEPGQVPIRLREAVAAEKAVLAATLR